MSVTNIVVTSIRFKISLLFANFIFSVILILPLPINRRHRWF